MLAATELDSAYMKKVSMNLSGQAGKKNISQKPNPPLTHVVHCLKYNVYHVEQRMQIHFDIMER